MLLSPSALSSWTTSLPPLEALRAELAVAVLLLTFPWETLSRSSSYCTTPALPWATSKNSVSPAFISIVSHWVGLGLQVPSPVAQPDPVRHDRDEGQRHGDLRRRPGQQIGRAQV